MTGARLQGRREVCFRTENGGLFGVDLDLQFDSGESVAPLSDVLFTALKNGGKNRQQSRK
jgi:hypothetical protein